MVVILCLLKTDSILHFGAKERFLHFRNDMSKPEDHDWKDHIVRTLQDIRDIRVRSYLVPISLC